MKISGIITINNAVSLGYPFIEAILSILPITDEFLINDGGSKDKTPFYLRKLKRTFPDKIKLFNKPHDFSKKWETIDECVEFLINEARGDWIFEVHGDELWHEKDILKIRKTIEKAHRERYNSIRAIRKGADFRLISPHVDKLVMIVRKLKELRSGDGGGDFRIGSCKPAKDFVCSNVPPELVTDFVYFNFFCTLFPDNTLPRAKANAEFFDRKQTYESLKSRPRRGPEPNLEIIKQFPVLIQGLANFEKYYVRKELFDKKFLKKLTGLNY